MILKLEVLIERFFLLSIYILRFTIAIRRPFLPFSISHHNFFKEVERIRVRGLIFGPFAEVSSDVEELITFLAQLKAQRLNELEGTNGNAKSLTGMIKKTLVLKLGLFVHRSWARCLIERVSHPGIIDYHHSRNLPSPESLDGVGFDMQ